MDNYTNEIKNQAMETIELAQKQIPTPEQQELTSVYVDSIMQLAYAKDEKGEITDKCNTLSLKMQRPMTDSNGETTLQECEINVPLLSLVPLPTFTMDELTVDFTMEVKASKGDTSKTEAEVNTNPVWFEYCDYRKGSF